jgi:hypothetical protein
MTSYCYCSKDRHWGALKLLRVLFERTVTLKYIAQNPGEAEAFLGVRRGGLECGLVGHRKTIRNPGRTKETQQHFQKAAKDARDRFRQEPCKECRLRKQTSWLSVGDCSITKGQHRKAVVLSELQGDVPSGRTRLLLRLLEQQVPSNPWASL